MKFALGRRITSVYAALSLHLSPQHPLSQRPKDMSPSQSGLGIFLSLILLAGLAGCGRASSDSPSNLESQASASGSVARGAGQGGKTGNTSTSSGNETDSESGKGPVPGGDSIGHGDKSATLAGTANVESDGRDKLPVLGVPESIAKGLESPDAQSRLQALDHWEKKGNKAPLDPVFEALEDENDAVRAKATAIIEQQWAVERERERG